MQTITNSNTEFITNSACFCHVIQYKQCELFNLSNANSYSQCLLLTKSSIKTIMTIV